MVCPVVKILCSKKCNKQKFKTKFAKNKMAPFVECIAFDNFSLKNSTKYMHKYMLVNKINL